MAFRRPLKIVDSDFQEMTDSDITLLRNRAIVNHGREQCVRIVPEGSIITFTITVQNVGGANEYFVNGVQRPNVKITEGSTFIFDWSAVPGHPLRLSTTLDGTHAGGVEYTTGVTVDTVNKKTTIIVAAGTPTLNYYCQNHSGMGRRAFTTTSGAGINELIDTRKVGGAISEVDSASAGNVTTLSVSYDRMTHYIDNLGVGANPVIDTNKISYPVYYESDGNSAHLKIRAMTDSDFKDTFIRPAITQLVNGGTGNQNQGVFFITQDSTSSNLVSSTPIFIDTVFDVNTYSGGTTGNLSLPEDSDQPLILAKYYLAQSPVDSSISPGSTLPQMLLIDSGSLSTSNPIIRQTDSGTTDHLLITSIKQTSRNDAHGYAIKYQTDSASGTVPGTQVGTSILDKSLTAGQKIFSNNVTGYFQALPYGAYGDSSGIFNVPATVTTYRLKVRKE